MSKLLLLFLCSLVYFLCKVRKRSPLCSRLISVISKTHYNERRIRVINRMNDKITDVPGTQSETSTECIISL